MTYTVGVFLLISGVAIIIGAVLQALQYCRGRHIITRGQFITRMGTAVLLVLIIVLIFVGALYPWRSPLHALIFWAVLVLLAITVIFLAMADLRQVTRQKHLHQAQIYRAMQDLQDLQDLRKKQTEETDE